MGFSRTSGLAERPPDPVLTSRMAGIGMNFAATAEGDAEIEETLVFASELGMLEGDLRVLGILVTWLETHREYINVSRLVRALRSHPETRLRGFWAASAASWPALQKPADQASRIGKQTVPEQKTKVDFVFSCVLQGFVLEVE